MEDPKDREPARVVKIFETSFTKDILSSAYLLQTKLIILSSINVNFPVFLFFFSTFFFNY